MKINVSREVDNAIDWPLRPGHALIVKMYGSTRWVRATFRRVDFPVTWVEVDEAATCLSAVGLGTSWIRCRKGKNGPPKMAERNDTKGTT